MRTFYLNSRNFVIIQPQNTQLCNSCKSFNDGDTVAIEIKLVESKTVVKPYKSPQNNTPVTSKQLLHLLSLLTGLHKSTVLLGLYKPQHPS